MSPDSAPVSAGWAVPAYRIDHWTGRSTDYCVVIPVINEGDRIGALLRAMADLGIPEVTDVVIADGGTTDGSLPMSLIEDCRVSGLLVKTGAGRLSAQLRAAYAFVLEQGYEGVVTIDGNGKDDPETIPLFVEALLAGVDFAQASRFIAGGTGINTPAVRDKAIRYLHAPVLAWSSGFAWTDTTQGYRGYSSALLSDPRVAVFREVFSEYELLAYLSHRAPRLGYRCREIPTVRRYPEGEVPTKITGVRGNAKLLKTLFLAASGRYDPARSPTMPTRTG